MPRQQQTTRPSRILTGGMLLLLVPVLLCLAAEPAPTKKESPPPAQPAADPMQEFDRDPTPKDLQHWSFRPRGIQTPPVPKEQMEWVKTPVDAFILQKLQAKKLKPSPAAEPRVWLRRVYFDLIGLPPTQAEVEAFEKDSSQTARERVVERLLADPGYGIRWGRHWLDVVRYADTNGYERDGDKPHVWRYRDWVIDSLNKDLPFDQFLTLQLAGDEVEHPTAETMVAATFLRLGTWDDEPADPLVDRYEQLDDIVKSVSASFMGMTLSCARCHNHKFEPLSQMDYTGMLAFFEPLKRPQNHRTDLDIPIGTPQEIAVFQQAQSRYEAALKEIEKQIQDLKHVVDERFLTNGRTSLPPDVWAAFKVAKKLRNADQKKLTEPAQKKFDEELQASWTNVEKQQLKAFEAALAAVKQASPPQLPRGYLWTENNPVPETKIFKRGNPATPAGPMHPRVPKVLQTVAWEPMTPNVEVKTTRRRLSLAHWLTNPQHPLTSRVIANRIWQGHFGEGLARTENDFGVMGTPPTHPELLDWLAQYLIDHKWSLKELHRVIVLSNTYQQASRQREDLTEEDPENELLGRFPYRRMEAEQIRDTLLLANGRLNPQMGGPGVYPPIPAEVLASQSKPGLGWGKSDEVQASRRSIYIHVKRSLLVPMFELMDLPDTTAPCEQRNISTIPTQALTLLNSEFMNDAAEHFAARIIKDGKGSVEEEVKRAYWLALSRQPTDDELKLSVEFVNKQRTRIVEETKAKPPTPEELNQKTMQAFCLVIFNLNEFVYLD
ncbi:MAG: DUF1549 and DUF1553 domain-containing protein [Planctomycetales bacterium]